MKYEAAAPKATQTILMHLLSSIILPSFKSSKLGVWCGLIGLSMKIMGWDGTDALLAFSID